VRIPEIDSQAENPTPGQALADKRQSEEAGSSGRAPGDPSAGEERLRLSRILTFATPAVGIGFMFFLVNLYLMKFSTDVLLIAPGVMGTIFGISRIWDALSDPIVGYLSDRTKTRLGRRRPWLLASLPPAAIVFVLVWSPPGGLSPRMLVVWMALGVIGFYTAMTLFAVPHASLGAALSTDHDERNRVFAWRHLFFMSGAFLAIAGMHLLITAEAPRETARALSLGAAVALAALILIAVPRMRERPEYMSRAGKPPFAALADVLANPHSRLLLSVVLIENMGVATITILTPYASEYLIGTPRMTPIYILGYMTASIATVLLWSRLAGTFDKKPLWILSMLVSGVAFGGMYFAGRGDWQWILAFSTLGGAAAGCGAVMGPSIQADVIDWDEHRTGERKEGTYFAAWNFVFKGSAGLTLLLTGAALQFAGFEPNVEQSESSQSAIRDLFSLLPFCTYLLGALLLSRFRLDRSAHSAIRAELDSRS